MKASIKKNNKSVFKFLVKYMKPYKKRIFLFLFIQLIFAVLDTLPFYMMGKVLDLIGGIKETQSYIPTLRIETIPPDLSKVFLYLSIFVLLISFVFVLGYFKEVWVSKMGTEIVRDLRGSLFEHIQSLDKAQIDNITLGKLVTRVVHSCESLGYFYSYLFIDIIYTISKLLVLLAFMFFISWYMAFVILAFVIVIIVISFIFKILAKKSYLKVKDNETNLNTFLSENLSGMQIVQVFNKEKQKKKEFTKVSNELNKSHKKTVFIFAIFRPLIYFIAILSRVLSFYLAIKFILNGQMTYGTAFAFFSLVTEFFWPIQQLTDQYNILQDALASGTKIYNIFNIKPKLLEKEDEIELKDFKGNIEFKDVWFKYKDDEWVLKGVSFKVNQNQTLAIVGPTGGGKTTILGLIVKNYIIQKGEILIDGININKIKASSIRKHVGQMLQDVFLFTGSVYDNLTFGQDKIQKDEVLKAINYIGADDIINNLKDGLNSQVLERGNNFSAGQRQLLSFVRTMLYKPQVLFLDEATANIDSQTEIKIQKSLKKIMNKNTMIVIAHRLSTIKDADNIIVLSHGRVIEEGNHEKLLKNKNFYYGLYNIQFSDQ